MPAGDWSPPGWGGYNHYPPPHPYCWWTTTTTSGPATANSVTFDITADTSGIDKAVDELAAAVNRFEKDFPAAPVKVKERYRLNPDRSFVPILLLILLVIVLLAWICF